jgi:hypothetical protein
MTEWTGKHGLSAYAVGKCRCDVCRKAGTAWTNQKRSQRRRYVELHGGPPPYVQHGRSCYVNWACRCDICDAAQSAYNANYAKTGQHTP